MFEHDNDSQVADSNDSVVRPENAFCLRCQEELDVYIPEGACHTCGLKYDIAYSETYRSRREFLRWKFWLPAFIMAVLFGSFTYADIIQNAELGWSLFLGVPIGVGAILGYGCRLRALPIVVLGVFAVAGIVIVIATKELAGLFCAYTLGIILLIPTGFGIVIGILIKYLLHRSAWDQRSFLPWILIVSFPYLMLTVELNVPRRTEFATIRTKLTVDATAKEAWDAIMFYEEVEHRPPMLLNLALPKPIRSVGSKNREGEIVRCIYDRGILVKRISRVVPEEQLVFDVMYQKLHFEKDVELKDGSFNLSERIDGKTDIVLATRYERKLSPAWIWQPIETKVVHTLHEHVLEGMRRHIKQRSNQRTDDLPIEFDGSHEFVPIARR